MRVKGAAFLARRREIIEQFGQERWERFRRELAERDPLFDDALFLTSRVPLDTFLRMHEALVSEFYGGDERSYFESGRAAASWALVSGPYAKAFAAGGDARELMTTVPAKLWRTYFDFGRFEVAIEGDEILVDVTGLPREHAYFELAVAGYMERALELLGAREISHRLSRPGPGHLRWVFTLRAIDDLSAGDGPASG